MAELTWKSPLANVIEAGIHGAVDGEPAVTIREVTRALWSVSPRSGAHSRVSDILVRDIGVSLPDPGCFTTAGDITVLWAGHRLWMLAGSCGGSPGEVDDLANALTAHAAVVAQGDGRAIVRIGGPGARQVLSRLTAVDLDPRRFGAGRVAATRIHHVGALLHQLDEASTFEIHVFRGFAESFYETLCQAAAPLGYRAEPLTSSPVAPSIGV